MLVAGFRREDVCEYLLAYQICDGLPPNLRVLWCSLTPLSGIGGGEGEWSEASFHLILRSPFDKNLTSSAAAQPNRNLKRHFFFSLSLCSCCFNSWLPLLLFSLNMLHDCNKRKKINLFLTGVGHLLSDREVSKQNTRSSEMSTVTFIFLPFSFLLSWQSMNTRSCLQPRARASWVYPRIIFF